MNPQDTQQPTETPQPTPAFQPPAASHPTPTPQPGIQPTGEDPGKTLAIIGIILAFFFNIVGLVLSIIARSKSKKAGFPTTLATIGIVLNSVFIFLSILGGILLAAIMITAYKGIEERGETVETATTAHTVIKQAETYYALTGAYPTSIAEFNSHTESSLSQDEVDDISSLEPYPGSDDVYVLTCGPEVGLTVKYWNNNLRDIEALYAGEIVDEATCTPIPAVTTDEASPTQDTAIPAPATPSTEG